MKKGLRFVFRSPPNRGFRFDRKVYSLIVFLFVVFHGTVGPGEPNENLTDHFQYFQRRSPKWFHNDLLFNCSMAKVGIASRGEMIKDS